MVDSRYKGLKENKKGSSIKKNLTNNSEEVRRSDGKIIREAAALRYSPENNAAPVLVAAGKGEIAEKIIEKANENNVPVYEDAGLAKTLNKQKLWTEIPSELYGVVAEILVFISIIDSSYGEKYAGKR